MPYEPRCKISISFCGSSEIFQKCAPVHSKIKLLFSKNHVSCSYNKYYIIVILKRSCFEETAQL